MLSFFRMPHTFVHDGEAIGGSKELVSKLVLRPEGPPVARPGRQAGIRVMIQMSAVGAAQHRFLLAIDVHFSAAPTALIGTP